MFELVFAWTVFTLVMGKSAEAVTHAWKGTAPPGHQRRMARIRAREAAGARRGIEPPNGFGRWARTVWADSWNAATERHKERWPAKAAKKRERARARWEWWDHVEDEAGQRWEKRRAARDSDGDAPAEEPETGPEEAPESETVAPDPEPEPVEHPRTERGQADPEDGMPSTTRGLITLQRLSEANLAVKQRDARAAKAAREAPKGASPIPPDTPDSAPKTPGQGADGGVRGPRTPGHPSVSGGGATIPTTEGDDMPGEVMNLSGATRFTRALHKSYAASSERLEEVLAWLHGQNITEGRLHDKFAAILAATTDTLALVEKAQHSCEEQLRVRDAVEAAGADALSKVALLKS
ncbi:hypothetical protein ACFW53_20600 [Nocardiopsis dassonvillei]|uniref:hypothetical protein n=1 Tax=Nocardiopsis dassonvillei TaxID=2014 RepID=UPI00366FE6F0